MNGVSVSEWMWLAVIVAGICMFGVPGRVARARHHRNAQAIGICGWLGLVTFGITWIVAIIWAYTEPRDHN